MKLNQKGFSHILMIVFIVAFAGLASYALSRTFAAKGGNGGGKGGGKTETSTLLTTTPTDQNPDEFLKGELIREKGKKIWRTSGDSDLNTWNWESLPYAAPTIGNYEICFELSAAKSANLRLTTAIGSENKGGQFAEDILIGYQGETQICRTVNNQTDYSGDVSMAMRYDLHVESNGLIDITKSTLRKL